MTQRSETEVLESLRLNIETEDESIDTEAGPLASFILRPFASEIAAIEEDQYNLSLLYSLSFAYNASVEQMDAFSSNYGIGRSLGNYATVVQYFYRNTRPLAGEVVNIPKGTPVVTRGGLMFRTITDVQITGSNADVYYNSSSRKYEVSTQVQAEAVGTDYNVAAYTITRLSGTLAGIDGTENRVAATGGTDGESNESIFTRAQAKMLGQDAGTHGGILSRVLNYDPIRITDAVVVFPTDWGTVLRRGNRPFLDIHVIGEHDQQDTYTYTAAGGELNIVLPEQPVTSITSVAVNNVAVSATLVKDTNNQTWGSYLATDTVQLSAALVAGDVLYVDYNYNSLINGMQSDLFSPVESSEDRTRLFNTDILVRAPIRVPITVVMHITALSGYDQISVQSNAQDLVYQYVEPGEFAGQLLPEYIRQAVLNNIPGVSQVNISEFRKTLTGVLDVEVIELKKNEEPYIDTTTFDIEVSL